MKRKGSAPKRPESVPAEATYNAADQQWELGKRNAEGKPLGEWRYWWATTGHLCCISHWEDGGRKETYTRLHPDGTYSCKGTEVNGKPAPNTVIHYQKSKSPTTELALTDPDYEKVFRVEETYIRKGLSKWKNFDAQGRRIALDGTLIPMLAPEKYAKNFGAFGLPETLVGLLELQNDVGAEMFAQGFALDVDDKRMLEQSCDADGRPLASKSKKKKFLAALLPIGTANGTGSIYCLWNHGKSKDILDFPAVVFGDEGGCHVVAESLHQLLSLVAADVEPMIDFDEISFFRAPDHEPSPEIAAFRRWLRDNVGVAAAKKPDAVVRRAQKRYASDFAAWLKSLR